MALDNDDDSRQRYGKPTALGSHTSKPRKTTTSFLPSFFGLQRKSVISHLHDQIARGVRETARDLPDRTRGGDRRTPDRDRDRDKGHHQTYPLFVPGARTRRPSPHRSSARAEPKPMQIDIKSLDPGYRDWTIDVKPGDSVRNIERIMRHKFAASDRPFGEGTAFRRLFASDGKELTQDDVVTRYLSPIWYRGSSLSDTWKFTHYLDRHGAQQRLDSALTEELVKDINAGATVKQLRRKIADQWDIEDANRVVLIAKGGFRPQSIKGNGWVVNEIKEKWLCRWIAIDICPEKKYYVLKGLGREYIFHPDQKFEHTLHMKEMLRDRVFRNVQQQYGKSSSFHLPCKSITLSYISYKGGVARNSHRPVWGGEYAFDLADLDQAEVFSNEEAWLLPATATCMVCIEDKKISDLPVRVTAGCKHELATCKACLDQWLTSSLESGTWDRLRCPECPELLKHADVHRYASKATFSRYDELVTREALKDLPHFRWCLSTACTSGQIDDAACTKFKCNECKSSHCIRHNVRWHKGETCEQYDKRNKKRLKDDKASEEVIKKTSKNCPECKKAVTKWTGCNHITCVCGHEWCYVCFAKFERNNIGFLFCRHKPECTEVDPFIDVVDNPHQQQWFPRPRPMREWVPRPNAAAARGVGERVVQHLRVPANRVQQQQQQQQQAAAARPVTPVRQVPPGNFPPQAPPRVPHWLTGDMPPPAQRDNAIAQAHRMHLELAHERHIERWFTLMPERPIRYRPPPPPPPPPPRELRRAQGQGQGQQPPLFVGAARVFHDTDGWMALAREHEEEWLRWQQEEQFEDWGSETFPLD